MAYVLRGNLNSNDAPLESARHGVLKRVLLWELCARLPKKTRRTPAGALWKLLRRASCLKEKRLVAYRPMGNAWGESGSTQSSFSCSMGARGASKSWTNSAESTKAVNASRLSAPSSSPQLLRRALLAAPLANKYTLH